jgi:hypothetical protein
MLKSIPAHLLMEWMSFGEIEPFGREWLQTGTIAAMIANVHIDHNKHDWLKAEDFIPGYQKIDPEPEDAAAKVDNYFTALAAASQELNKGREV